MDGLRIGLGTIAGPTTQSPADHPAGAGAALFVSPVHTNTNACCRSEVEWNVFDGGLVSPLRWHLDEIYVRLNSEMVHLWRAVHHEGKVLENYASKTRDKAAALAFGKRR